MYDSTISSPKGFPTNKSGNIWEHFKNTFNMICNFENEQVHRQSLGKVVSSSQTLHAKMALDHWRRKSWQIMANLVHKEYLGTAVSRGVP